MMMFAMVSLLVGMVLGQRFSVLILVPGIGLALVVTIVAGIARADAAWPIILTSAAVITSLQIGYLAGIAIRHLLVAGRARRSHANPLNASMPARRPAH
jgi:hypothetical protein